MTRRSGGPATIAAIVVLLLTTGLAMAAKPTGLPDANPDRYDTPAGTKLVVAAPGVLANDSDPDGDPLEAVLVAEPGSGSLALKADGAFTFVPAAGFHGNVTFRYRASDGQSSSTAVAVQISVTASAATPTPRPTPTPTPTAEPDPSANPVPSPAPSPAASPTLGPTASPSPEPSTGARPSPGPGGQGGAAGGGPRDADGSGPGVRGDNGSKAAGSGGDSTDIAPGSTLGGPTLVAPPANAVEFATGGLGVGGLGVEWAVPTLILTVPGILLIVGVGGQALVAALLIPLSRRYVGGRGAATLRTPGWPSASGAGRGRRRRLRWRQARRI